METIKKTAANAKSGVEKTKATLQDKVMPTRTKEDENQVGADTGTGTGGSYSYSTTGEEGKSTGSHQMSALPGHGTGEPAGQVVEGTIKSHPIGKAGRPTTAHNTHVGGGGTNQGYGTGGAYSG